MSQFKDQILLAGVPVIGAELRVFNQDKTRARIFDDLGTDLNGIVKSDAFGVVTFNAAKGVYRGKVYYQGRLRYDVANLVVGDAGEIFQGNPGPAGNVAATLAQLKSAAIANVTMIYEGITYNIESLNGRTPNDSDIVQSTVDPTKAWVAVVPKMDDGANIKQAIAVAATVTALVASNDALTVGSTVRTADGYIYEVAAAGTAAFDEATNPTGYHLLTAGGAKLKLVANDRVSPEMLAGNLHMAASYAYVHGITLTTPRVDYEVQNAFTPHDITWISDDTRIKQMRLGTGGINPLDSVLYPGSNLVHIGRTYLYLADTGGTAMAYRSHCLMGRWDTGVGPSNIVFDELVCEAGHSNCNGVSMAGNATKIRIRRVVCGDNNKIGRLVMLHWGNFSNHWMSGGNYAHAPSATPTTHPNDIKIGEIVAGNLTNSNSDFNALLCISAGYDVEVGEVRGNISNAAGGSNLVLLTAGDLGFAYATATERAHGMRGIKIGRVQGSSSKQGYRLIGRALYFDKDTTPQPADYYLAKIQDVVGEIDMVGSTSLLFEGLAGTNGRGKSRYGKVTVTGFKHAIAFPNYSTKIQIDYLEAINMQSLGMGLNVGSGTDATVWPEDIHLGTVRINGTGAQEATLGQSVAFKANKVRGLHIGRLIIDNLKAGVLTSGEIQADVQGVTINEVTLNWLDAAQTSIISSVADGNKFVDVGQVVGAQNVQPVSGGVTSRVIGRNREYHYFGGAVPNGITVRVGDRFVAATATTGQPWLSIVTTAGVTGSGAVLSGQMVA